MKKIAVMLLLCLTLCTYSAMALAATVTYSAGIFASEVTGSMTADVADTIRKRMDDGAWILAEGSIKVMALWGADTDIDTGDQGGFGLLHASAQKEKGVLIIMSASEAEADIFVHFCFCEKYLPVGSDEASIQGRSSGEMDFSLEAADWIEKTEERFHQ